MAKYDISTFTWYDQEPKRQEMRIGVSESCGLRFNAELQKRLPERFRLCVSPDKRVLCIVESEEGTITLTKNGSRKLPKLQRDIEDAGVILPARYVFYAEDGMLFGELRVPKPPKPGTSKRKKATKSRRISKSQEKYILEGLNHGKLC